MKRLALFLIPFALLIADGKKKTPPPPLEPPKIPAGAKEVEPYLFRYTDAQGKKWFYRETPFGVVKWEDKPVAATPSVDNTNPIQITDLGESVQFKWKTPFGEQQWVRKKTELTDDEKALIQREQDKRPAPDAKPRSDPKAKNSENQL